MVQVRTTQLVGRDGSFDSAGWAASLQLRDGSEARLERAAEAAIAAAAEGDFGAFHTGLEMVQILHELRLEGDALVAALLYRSVRQGLLELDAVRAEFGEEVARLIDGVLRMAVISRMIQPVDGPVLGQHQSQSDNVRRMLVSLIDDVRIALLKLAERCCAIRSVKNRPDKQIRVAREVSHIYAPLAQRLGVGHIKWELEDLAFRYLQPEDYRYVAQLLDERRLDRQEYIALVIAQLGGALQAQQLDADIFGRPKHIYSIWRKMQHKRIGFSEVFDVRALRVLVDRVADCYAVLGVVHTLWPNISSEFDDYIANPKVNGYQSLHTAVYGPQGKVLEVQIRTRQMHEAAEYGVCAHWQYKGLDASPGAVDGYNQKIAWLRQVLVWHDELGERADLRGPLGEGIAEDRVYVFTPDGHVVDLPEGATPVDFAYYIHTEVGHRCRGAKVNGRIVPLTYKLRTGEQIHILTGKAAAPSRDWLRSDLGYVRSTRTRSRIQQWFRLQAREQNLALGRTVLEREFKRLALTAVDYRAGPPLPLQGRGGHVRRQRRRRPQHRAGGGGRPATGGWARCQLDGPAPHHRPSPRRRRRPHLRPRCGQSDDAHGRLLQPPAGRGHHRLHHPGARHHHSPQRLQETAAAAAPAGPARDRSGLGRGRRGELSRNHRHRGLRPQGPAARCDGGAGERGRQCAGRQHGHQQDQQYGEAAVDAGGAGAGCAVAAAGAHQPAAQRHRRQPHERGLAWPLKIPWTICCI